MEERALNRAAHPTSDSQLSIGQLGKDHHAASTKTKHPSIMRSFLESGVEFNWPKEVGLMKDNNCHIHKHVKRVPLIHKRKISDRKAIIDEFNVDMDYPYNFKLPFIVKEARSDKGGTHREEAAKEINNMRDLRHPHIAALLGTYEYQARLCILIFPVASCDLDQFMRCISADIRGEDLPTQELSRMLCRWDSTGSSVASGNAKGDLAIQKGDEHPQDSQVDYWPLDIPLSEKKAYLCRYFICLSRALSYLHESGVRHKDVKPANILIDRSGSAILTDFGISKRFSKNESHVTSTERVFTKKYGSPEMMNSRPTPRGDQSDIFSLGCVFLEMASLVLDHDHTLLQDHCSHVVNDTAREDAYHLNLPKAYSWLDRLRSPQITQVSNIGTLLHSDLGAGDDPGVITKAIVTSLPHIRKMLDVNPKERPRSADLWLLFQSISTYQCEDCDPRRPNDIWKPSSRQQEIAETGRSKRRDAFSDEIQRNSDVRPRRSSLAPIESQDTQPRKRTRPRSYPPAVYSKDINVPKVPAIVKGGKVSSSSRPSTPKLEETKKSKEKPQSPQHSMSDVPNNLNNHIVTEDKEKAFAELDTESDHLTKDKSETGDIPTDESTTYDSAPDDNGESMPARSRTPSPKKLSAYTPVMAYNFRNKLVFQTQFCGLPPVYKVYDLPRSGQHVTIMLDKQKALILNIDLGNIGIWNRLRRYWGTYDQIYVIYYDE